MKNMQGIPPELNERLHNLLLESDVIHNGRQLFGLFSDERLKPWRNGLPQADNAIARVDLLIDYLHNKTHSDYQENALLLFLRVLYQRVDPNDTLHADLEQLMADMAAMKESPSTFKSTFDRRDDLLPHNKYRKELVSIARQMINSINLSELKNICFELIVDFDELQGETLSEKTHALLLLLNRQKRIPDLLDLLQEIRPKIAWKDIYKGFSK